MNKSEIGIEELRERLAKFVGWEVPEERPITLYGVEIGKQLIQKNDGPFQPDIDRNQTALLLGKITDPNQQSKIIEKLAPHPAILGYALRHMWVVLAAPPETICRAILEVMSQEKPNE